MAKQQLAELYRQYAGVLFAALLKPPPPTAISSPARTH